jgi:hypothetical protein
MTEGKDSRETVSMSTNDDGEAKRTQHQRALLHNAPKAPLREPKPGELLMTFEQRQDVYRVELRDFQPNGVMRRGLGCLVPQCGGGTIDATTKETLWDRYFTEAPRLLTPSEQQYSDRRLRSRR